MKDIENFYNAPWEYRPSEHDDWGVIKSSRKAIAKVSWILDKKIEDKHRDLGSDPFEAHARLIAAAPDLLQALELLVSIQDRCYPRGMEPLTIIIAKRAIEKAGVEDYDLKMIKGVYDDIE